MKIKEIEVLTRNGKELTRNMLNLDPESEDYRINSAKFNFLLKIMEELKQLDD